MKFVESVFFFETLRTSVLATMAALTIYGGAKTKKSEKHSRNPITGAPHFQCS
jgi:hypothetical protein